MVQCHPIYRQRSLDYCYSLPCSEPRVEMVVRHIRYHKRRTVPGILCPGARIFV